MRAGDLLDEIYKEDKNTVSSFMPSGLPHNDRETAIRAMEIWAAWQAKFFAIFLEHHCVRASQDEWTYSEDNYRNRHKIEQIYDFFLAKQERMEQDSLDATKHKFTRNPNYFLGLQ